MISWFEIYVHNLDLFGVTLSPLLEVEVSCFLSARLTHFDTTRKCTERLMCQNRWAEIQYRRLLDRLHEANTPKSCLNTTATQNNFYRWIYFISGTIGPFAFRTILFSRIILKLLAGVTWKCSQLFTPMCWLCAPQISIGFNGLCGTSPGGCTQLAWV